MLPCMPITLQPPLKDSYINTDFDGKPSVIHEDTGQKSWKPANTEIESDMEIKSGNTSIELALSVFHQTESFVVHQLS